MAFFKGASKEAHRATILKQQRTKDRQEIEFKKKKIESELNIEDEISNIFTARQETEDMNFAPETVGLVTLEELKAQQEAIIAAREKLANIEKAEKSLDKESSNEHRVNIVQKGPVSFESDDDESEEDIKYKFEEKSPPTKKKRYGVNPKVDTRFVPDIYRKEEENKLREDLKKEWMEKQISIKEEEIRITYSYWDGSGHRRDIVVKKGFSVQLFLTKCLEQLRKEFPELKAVSVDKLMYIKEDLIIPHHNTFYDFIVTKARGKSGPLFVFEARDDIRIIQDASIEKEDSHAGKVCLRSWYERNKHIFPASRWEPYDPVKNWDQYTVADKMSAKIVVK